MNLLAYTKAELLRSNKVESHPFRYFTLATFGEYPEMRTVVKRDITDKLVITAFTDSRTPKVEQIEENDKVSVLFYHPVKKLQVRMYATAKLITKDHLAYAPYLKQVLSEADWRKDYTSVDTPGVPKKDEGTLIYGSSINLTVLRLHPTKLDIVLLGKEHHRSKCELISGEWIETVVVP